MSSSPAYASTPHNAAAVITGTETNLAVPTAAVSVFSAGSNGSKIEEIVVEAYYTTLVPTTAVGLVYIFLYETSNTTYYLYDVYTVTAITASATAAGFRLSKPYNNLVLASGWSVYAAQSQASNASHLLVHCYGGDY